MMMLMRIVILRIVVVIMLMVMVMILMIMMMIMIMITVTTAIRRIITRKGPLQRKNNTRIVGSRRRINHTGGGITTNEHISWTELMATIFSVKFLALLDQICSTCACPQHSFS